MILSEKHIILTHSGSTDSFQILEKFGATLHHFPMIYIAENSYNKPFNLSDFDYYVFTSKNGVKSFFNCDFVKGKTINTICLGEKTRNALIENGVEPVFISEESYADNLITELVNNQMVRNKKILLVLGNLADNRIEEGLSSTCNVSRINIYQTNLETSKKEDITNLLKNRNTISIFTSPSSFQAFSNLYDSEETTLASIGTTTSESIESSGFTVKIIATEQTYDGISKAIINYYETKNISL
ncbi:MAG: Uncharacterised protein [Cryomorphaceae bacterium]|nr:MAG: Uncharacterised protein [Cryomorphaceae bacterium]